MRVIGIDPGYDRLGVSVVEYRDDKETVVHSTCLLSDREQNLTERIVDLANQFSDILKEHQPDALAIETLFFNKNLKTAVGVAQIRGVIIYLAKTANCDVYEFGPQEIKVAATGYGKSDKQAVISMIKQIVKGAPEDALDDEYDAIAVGITCLAHHGRGR